MSIKSIEFSHMNSEFLSYLKLISSFNFFKRFIHLLPPLNKDISYFREYKKAITL